MSLWTHTKKKSKAMSKSIENMAHDYVVACLQAGKRQDDINIDVAIEMAEEVKRKARPIDAQLAKDDLEEARYRR